MVKKTKKEKKITKIANPIEEMIKNADEGIIVTSKNGNVEVTGIKNINYSHQAKGLLVGALDSYLLRPVLNIINANAKNTVAHIKAAVEEIKKETVKDTKK